MKRIAIVVPSNKYIEAMAIICFLITFLVKAIRFALTEYATLMA